MIIAKYIARLDNLKSRIGRYITKGYSRWSQGMADGFDPCLQSLINKNRGHSSLDAICQSVEAQPPKRGNC